MPALLIKYALSYVWSVLSEMAELAMLNFLIEQCLYVSFYLFATLVLMLLVIFFTKRTLRVISGMGEKLVGTAQTIIYTGAQLFASSAVSTAGTSASSLGAPSARKELPPPSYSATRLMKSAKKEVGLVPSVFPQKEFNSPPSITAKDLARRNGSGK